MVEAMARSGLPKTLIFIALFVEGLVITGVVSGKLGCVGNFTVFGNPLAAFSLVFVCLGVSRRGCSITECLMEGERGVPNSGTR